MTHPLANLSVLDKFKHAPFPPGYPTDRRSFFAPVDNVKGVLLYVFKAATKSIVLGMYGMDDDELAAIIKQKLADPDIAVQITLDATQAGGVHERTLLAQESYPASSIAVGSSEHGRIMHLKMFIIDGVIVGKGSTNWSDAAERLQDNELSIEANAHVAAEARARIDAIHANMLAKAKAH